VAIQPSRLTLLVYTYLLIEAGASFILLLILLLMIKPKLLKM